MLFIMTINIKHDKFYKFRKFLQEFIKIDRKRKNLSICTRAYF